MIPVGMEGAVRELDSFLGRPLINNLGGGPCARDLASSCPRDYVSSGSSSGKPEVAVERYAIGVNGEMRVLRGNEREPLSFRIPRGYDFEI